MQGLRLSLSLCPEYHPPLAATMASYPVSYHTLRDSIVSNASEKKGYNPFRIANISSDKSGSCIPIMLNLTGPSTSSAVASRQPVSPPPSSRAPPSTDRRAPSNNNLDELHISSREQRLCVSQFLSRHPSREGQNPDLEYVYISPERKLHTSRSTQSSNSGISFDRNSTPRPQPVSRAGPRRSDATLYTTAERVREWDDPDPDPYNWFSDVGRQYASSAYRTSSMRTTQNLRAHVVPSAQPMNSDSDRHAGYVAVHVYAEVPESEDASTNPLCCIAYISGKRKNARRRLEDEYTVLRLHLAGSATYKHEVRFARGPFPELELRRKLSLAMLKCIPLAWLTYEQLGRLTYIASGLRGGPPSY